LPPDITPGAPRSTLAVFLQNGPARPPFVLPGTRQNQVIPFGANVTDPGSAIAAADLEENKQQRML